MLFYRINKNQKFKYNIQLKYKSCKKTIFKLIIDKIELLYYIELL